MEEYRKVKKVVTGNAAQDGAGVKLTRVLGPDTVGDFDPFLMLDAFDSKDPSDYTKGFPWHPHRGIETVTYLISGDIEHGDSMGNRGSIQSGECQWMTAGSGVIHQEMPKPCDHMLGTQLWINLPASEKMAAPAYNSISDIPEVQEDGAVVKIVAGRYHDQTGAFSGRFVDATYLDVSLAPAAKWDYSSIADDTLFVYIYDGEGYFEPGRVERFSARRALLFTPGGKVGVEAGEQGVRFLLLTAKPLKEPVAWGGPIVMNTPGELDEAFEELNENTFIRDK